MTWTDTQITPVMNEHFDVHGYIDGCVVTYLGEIIWRGKTSTGACRAMIAFREVHRQAAEDLARVLSPYVKESGL